MRFRLSLSNLCQTLNCALASLRFVMVFSRAIRSPLRAHGAARSVIGPRRAWITREGNGPKGPLLHGLLLRADFSGDVRGTPQRLKFGSGQRAWPVSLGINDAQEPERLIPRIDELMRSISRHIDVIERANVM